MKIKVWVFHATSDVLALNIDFGQPVTPQDALALVQQHIAPFPTSEPPPDYDFFRAGCIPWPFQWSDVPACVHNGRYWGPEIKHILRMGNGVVRVVIARYGRAPISELVRMALPKHTFGAETAPDAYATFLEIPESEAK